MNTSLLNRSLVRLGLVASAVLFAGVVQTVDAQATIYVDDDAPTDPGPGNPFIPSSLTSLEDGSTTYPYDTVQEAINAAMSGDTILVEPGTYFELASIDLSGFDAVGDPAGVKSLVIQSTTGPALTIIDGAHLSGALNPHIVRAVQGESAGTVFDGFTLRNAIGGGSSADTGGALYILNSSPTIRDCRIQTSSAYVGGGLYINNSTALVEDCRFEFNDAVHQGGAVYTNNGQPVFANCTFEGNSANYGGAFLSRTTGVLSGVTVRECLFYGNTSLVGYGGAFAKFDNGTCLIERSSFVGNTSARQGSGVHISGGGVVSDCVFNGNTANLNEGALNAETTGALSVRGTTLVENAGGALREGGGAQMTASNSIVWDNLNFEVGAGVTISYSNVLGGAAGTGNIDADPNFIDPIGADSMRGTLDDNLRLGKGSPCIDAGNTSEVATAYPLDHAGNARVINTPATTDTGVALVGQVVDMGAFEHQLGGRHIRGLSTLR